MTRIQRGALWSVCALAGIAAVIPARADVDANAIALTFDALHVPATALFAFALADLMRRMPANRRDIAVVAICFAIILGGEVVQPYIGRSRSGGDVLYGLLGVALGLFAARAHFDGRIIRRRAAWILVAGTSLLAAVPAIRAWAAIDFRRRALPMLGDFERRAELEYWTAQGYGAEGPPQLERAQSDATHGTHALRVDAPAGDWMGVTMEVGDLDWSAWDVLAFDVTSERPLTLQVRIDDDGDTSWYGSRYEQVFDVAAGGDTVRIPLSEVAAGLERPIDLGAIRRMMLHLGEGSPPTVFWLDHVRLESGVAEETASTDAEDEAAVEPQ